jgi:hypothetical protein
VLQLLFAKPPQRINGVRLVSFDPEKRKAEEAKAKQRAYHRGWYRRNREKVLEKVRAWEEAHPGQAMERKARYQARNVEKYRKIKRDYMRRQRALNPERVRVWRSGNA